VTSTKRADDTPEVAHLGVRPRALSDRLEAAPGRYLLFFSVIYLIAECCSNHRREFWCDELITYHLANLPSISQILPLIRKGIELNPPLPFWITWIVHHTLGSGEVLTRLPGVIGFWAMCLCLFWFVRRRSDASHGFLALILPLFTYTAWDGTWARGYGLLLGFSGAALLSWQLASDGVRRQVTVPAMALSIAGAISCHYYALYVFGALGIGELVRTLIGKRIDWPVLVGMAGGVALLAAYIPLLRTAKAASTSFWITPMPRFLYESYADLFGPAAMVFLLLALWTLRLPGSGTWTPPATLAHEVAACATFSAMPLVVFATSQFTTVPFFTRYVQPVVIGFTVTGVLFLYRFGGSNRRFRNVAISLVVWVGFAPWAFWHIIQETKGDLWPSVQNRLALPTNPSLPVVIAKDDDFMVAYHYAPPSTRKQLYFLSDTRSALRYSGSDTWERSLTLAQTFHDFHMIGYVDFISRHREFFVERTAAEEWVLMKLLADGADVRLVDLHKPLGSFVDDRLLFHVNIR
jgi:hypothetical protein